MEEMETDLHRIINLSDQDLSAEHIKCLVKQLLEGMKAIHQLGIIHRDIKPANILVNQDCSLRITDFGLSRYYNADEKREDSSAFAPPQLTEYVVTRWYRAPELLLSPFFEYSTAVDM